MLWQRILHPSCLHDTVRKGIYDCLARLRHIIKQKSRTDCRCEEEQVFSAAACCFLSYYISAQSGYEKKKKAQNRHAQKKLTGAYPPGGILH